jgi:hypothetical protein
MPGTIALPSADFLRRLLGELLGKQVTVSAAHAEPLDPEAPAVVGVYESDDGAVVALCRCEVTLATAAGAALTLAPPSVVEEAARTGAMPEAVVDNTREVLDVSARMFNNPGTPRVRLRELRVTPGELPAEAAGILQEPGRRADFDLQVEPYGDGRMTVLTI